MNRRNENIRGGRGEEMYRGIIYSGTNSEALAICREINHQLVQDR